MLFNSLQFMIFFSTVVIMYFMLPYKYRWLLLLASSYYFYMSWKPEYILLIVVSTLIDYFASILMSNTTEKGKRKKYLYLSIFSNLGLLFIFKYFNFFNTSLGILFTSFNVDYEISNLDLLLPMGISFYTFQTMSYTIDVYRGVVKPEKNLGMFALYVTFFPQLVAGPIERSESLLTQFYKKYDFDYERVTSGLKRMAWGFFKKVVIADRLAIVVNTVYSNPTEYTGIALVVATVFFAYQIYYDFSGYSDIAIGAARIMGFRLMENFNSPYYSKSISEFWGRWHISLSTWFRDYLYIPLGGNRVKLPRYLFNLFITFLISGLWHGANWTFVAWGALHGIYLIMGKIYEPLKGKIVRKIKLDRVPFIHKLVRVTVTFSLVCFSWIFFRANSISDAIYIVKNLFVNISSWISFAYLRISLSNIGLSRNEFLFAVLSILLLETVQLLNRGHDLAERISKQPLYFRFALYYALLLLILSMGVFGQSAFIYFQF